MIIYGTIITRGLLCTVHERVNAMYRSMEYLPPVTVQDIVPPRRKNEHTRDNHRGKCPQIFPGFFFLRSRHRIRSIDLDRCAAHTLEHFSSICLSHLFIYMLAANATISSEVLHTKYRSLTCGRIHELFK